ncbi:MAG: Holliday junction branch migration protein RuvA [Balneolaceae bacterium]
MIAFLEGKLESKSTDSAILNVHGVGYRVEISNPTCEKLPDEGTEVKLLIHHHITDNDQRLFGFFSRQEQTLFEKLITVKGIGPKLGLTIMSGMEAHRLIESILQADQHALSQISGIGKKTADRIILELKDKIFKGFDPQQSTDFKSGLTGSEEAVSALEALGFRKKEAEKAVASAAGENSEGTVSDIVKIALSKLKS